jgi:hypothetical protein
LSRLKRLTQGFSHIKFEKTEPGESVKIAKERLINEFLIYPNVKTTFSLQK